MEVELGHDPTLARNLLYMILDTSIALEEKLTRVSAAIDGGGVDVGCTVCDDPALGGAFPLLLSISVGSAELVELLLSHGADVNQALEYPFFQQAVCPTALHQACLDGRLDLVEILTTIDEYQSSSSRGFCSSYLLDLESTNARNQTPFHLAVESGNSDLVGYLSEKGSWIEACDANGNNALHMTTCLVPDQFALNMVDTLVTLGVSIYHRNRLGFTPVKLAMLLGRETSAKVMLSNTSHGRRLQEVGFHPLEAAVVTRRRRAIASILERPSGGLPVTDESLNLVVLNAGLNGILDQLLTSPQMRSVIDVNGSLGYTPLYNACASRNTDAVRMLLEAGADPDRPSQRLHVLPLKKAVLQNDPTTSRLLLDFGASACHCPECSPLLRPCSSARSQRMMLVGIQDGELDLLYLALFTDVALCQLLISGGTCVSSKAVQILSSAAEDDSSEHRSLLVDLYRAGFHAILKQVLEKDASTEVKDGPRDHGDLLEMLRSPPDLQLLCRVQVRRAIKPRVHWAVRRLSLPQFIKRYLLLET